MRRLLQSVAFIAIVLAGSSCAARYRGNVTLEDQKPVESEVPAAGTGTRARYATRPPACNGDLPLPDYPPELLGPSAPVVRVRVDFLLTDEGKPEEIVASFTDGKEQESLPGVPGRKQGSAPFLEAAETALSQWRCRPAWRPPMPSEPATWVTLSYRTWIVFRFDAERVERKASIERKR